MRLPHPNARLALPAAFLAGLLACRAADAPRPVAPDASGRVALKAGDALIVGAGPRLETRYGRDNIGYWSASAASLEFRIAPPPRPGTYRLELDYGCADNSAGSEVEIWVGPALAVFGVKGTGVGWETSRTVELGAVDVEGSAPVPVRIRVARKPGAAVMNFYELRLLPLPRK